MLKLCCAQFCLTLATPWTVACQAPLFMGFFRQEYWSGLLFPPPGDLSDPGIEPKSPALQVDSLPSEQPGKTIFIFFPIMVYQRILNLVLCAMEQDLVYPSYM